MPHSMPTVMQMTNSFAVPIDAPTLLKRHHAVDLSIASAFTFVQALLRRPDIVADMEKVWAFILENQTGDFKTAIVEFGYKTNSTAWTDVFISYSTGDARTQNATGQLVRGGQLNAASVPFAQFVLDALRTLSESNYGEPPDTFIVRIADRGDVSVENERLFKLAGGFHLSLGALTAGQPARFASRGNSFVFSYHEEVLIQHARRWIYPLKRTAIEQSVINTIGKISFERDIEQSANQIFLEACKLLVAFEIATGHVPSADRDQKALYCTRTKNILKSTPHEFFRALDGVWIGQITRKGKYVLPAYLLGTVYRMVFDDVPSSRPLHAFSDVILQHAKERHAYILACLRPPTFLRESAANVKSLAVVLVNVFASIFQDQSPEARSLIQTLRASFDSGEDVLERVLGGFPTEVLVKNFDTAHYPEVAFRLMFSGGAEAGYDAYHARFETLSRNFSSQSFAANGTYFFNQPTRATASYDLVYKPLYRRFESATVQDIKHAALRMKCIRDVAVLMNDDADKPRPDAMPVDEVAKTVTRRFLSSCSHKLIGDGLERSATRSSSRIADLASFFSVFYAVDAIATAHRKWCVDSGALRWFVRYFLQYRLPLLLYAGTLCPETQQSISAAIGCDPRFEEVVESVQFPSEAERENGVASIRAPFPEERAFAIGKRASVLVNDAAFLAWAYAVQELRVALLTGGFPRAASLQPLSSVRILELAGCQVYDEANGRLMPDRLPTGIDTLHAFVADELISNVFAALHPRELFMRLAVTDSLAIPTPDYKRGLGYEEAAASNGAVVRTRSADAYWKTAHSDRPVRCATEVVVHLANNCDLDYTVLDPCARHLTDFYANGNLVHHIWTAHRRDAAKHILYTRRNIVDMLWNTYVRLSDTGVLSFFTKSETIADNKSIENIIKDLGTKCQAERPGSIMEFLFFGRGEMIRKTRSSLGTIKTVTYFITKPPNVGTIQPAPVPEPALNDLIVALERKNWDSDSDSDMEEARAMPARDAPSSSDTAAARSGARHAAVDMAAESRQSPEHEAWRYSPFMSYTDELASPYEDMI